MDRDDFNMIPQRFHVRLHQECEGRLFFRPSYPDPTEGAAYFLNGKRTVHKTKNDNGVKYSGTYVEHYVFNDLITDLSNVIKYRPQYCFTANETSARLTKLLFSKSKHLHIFDINLEDFGGYNWEVEYFPEINMTEIFEYIKTTTPKEPFPQKIFVRYKLIDEKSYMADSFFFNFNNKETVSALTIARTF